jgi:hypothetical protein
MGWRWGSTRPPKTHRVPARDIRGESCQGPRRREIHRRRGRRRRMRHVIFRASGPSPNRQKDQHQGESSDLCYLRGFPHLAIRDGASTPTGPREPHDLQSAQSVRRTRGTSSPGQLLTFPRMQRCSTSFSSLHVLHYVIFSHKAINPFLFGSGIHGEKPPLLGQLPN